MGADTSSILEASKRHTFKATRCSALAVAVNMLATFGADFDYTSADYLSDADYAQFGFGGDYGFFGVDTSCPNAAAVEAAQPILAAAVTQSKVAPNGAALFLCPPPRFSQTSNILSTCTTLWGFFIHLR